MVRERQVGAVVVDQAFQPVRSGGALQKASGHAQRAKPGIDKIGQVTELCVCSPDGIIKGHVVCNDGALPDARISLAVSKSRTVNLVGSDIGIVCTA